MYKLQSFLTVLLLPVLVSAQTVTSIFGTFTGVVGDFVKFAVAVALLVFIWGIVRFMTASGVEPEKGKVSDIEQGKKRMLWGVVGLFMIVSIWGVVGLLMQIFGVDTIVTQPPISISI